MTLLGGESLADRAVELYRERFADVGLFENSVYPDIDNCAGGARAAGASHVRRDQQAACLCHSASSIILGLRGYFEHVFGSELDGTRVHKDDLLAYAIEQPASIPRRR